MHVEYLKLIVCQCKRSGSSVADESAPAVKQQRCEHELSASSVATTATTPSTAPADSHGAAGNDAAPESPLVVLVNTSAASANDETCDPVQPPYSPFSGDMSTETATPDEDVYDLLEKEVDFEVDGDAEEEEEEAQRKQESEQPPAKEMSPRKVSKERSQHILMEFDSDWPFARSRKYQMANVLPYQLLWYVSISTKQSYWIFTNYLA